MLKNSKLIKKVISKLGGYMLKNNVFPSVGGFIFSSVGGYR